MTDEYERIERHGATFVLVPLAEWEAMRAASPEARHDASMAWFGQVGSGPGSDYGRGSAIATIPIREGEP